MKKLLSVLAAVLMAGALLVGCGSDESTVQYLVGHRAELMNLDEHGFEPPLINKFCCAVKADDKALLDELNGALASMKADGTLDALTKKYIDDVEDEPEAVEMPKQRLNKNIELVNVESSARNNFSARSLS